MKKSITKNVGIILGCSIIAKILSYIWEAILAAYMGASDQSDAFYMMLNIYNILYPALDLGIWKVFLPIYKTKLVKDGESKTEEVANIAMTFFFLMSIALVLLIIFLAEPLTFIMAPGFSAEKRAITVEYLRYTAPMYLLMACSSVVGAILQSREKFFGSQIRELGTHFSKIIFIVITFKYWGIYAALTAFIVGSIFRLIVQLPFVNWGWKFRPDFHFKNQDVHDMIKGLPSVAVTSAISHINGMIDKMVASVAVSGAIACLNYGHKLMNVFSGMISTAIGTATYPTMIQFIAEKKENELKKLITRVVGVLAFFIIPISIYCMVFSDDLVTVAFQRGAFNAAATSLTAEVFWGYTLGMYFIGLSTIISNVFYAYGDTKITMYFSLLNIALNIVFDLTFYRLSGVGGLAIATSVSSIICLAGYLIVLKKYITLDYRNIIIEVGKILVAAAVANVSAYVMFVRWLHMNVYISVILSAVIVFCVTVGISFLLKVQAVNYAADMIKRKIGR